MSAALEEWREGSDEIFDEIERMLQSVDGAGGDRRVVTQQLSYAYAMLITAHFQRYCRELHAEAAQILVARLLDPELAEILEGLLAIEASDRRNKDRKAELERLCEWRNAIVHGDIARKRAEGRLVPHTLNLDTCRSWRRALGSLAFSIDRVISAHCKTSDAPSPGDTFA
jgi:hypothetical protein